MEKNVRKIRILLGNKEIKGYSIKKPVELELSIEKVTIPDSEPGRLNWKLEEIREYVKVSIAGEVWQSNCGSPHRDCIEAGQIIETVKELFSDSENVLEICELWKEWHLNDMKGGTIEQEYFLKGYRVGNPEWKYDYSEACNVLRACGLYRIGRIPFRKELIDGKEVQAYSAYTYGSKWLVREIPESAVNSLIALFEIFPEGKGN